MLNVGVNYLNIKLATSEDSEAQIASGPFGSQQRRGLQREAKRHAQQVAVVKHRCVLAFYSQPAAPRNAVARQKQLGFESFQVELVFCAPVSHYLRPHSARVNARRQINSRAKPKNGLRPVVQRLCARTTRQARDVEI
jgi:hypothetical protein